MVDASMWMVVTETCSVAQGTDRLRARRLKGVTEQAPGQQRHDQRLRRGQLEPMS
jgi:hypothetical protein